MWQKNDLLDTETDQQRGSDKDWAEQKRMYTEGGLMRKWLQLWLIELETDVKVELMTNTEDEQEQWAHWMQGQRTKAWEIITEKRQETLRAKDQSRLDWYKQVNPDLDRCLKKRKKPQNRKETQINQDKP